MSEGKLASALANHFGQGFDLNFDDDPRDLGDDFAEDEQRYRESLERARSYTKDMQVRDGLPEDRLDGGTGDEDPLTARPLSMRSLQWIRRNMTSLRVIVSLQRVTPQDAAEGRPRKTSGY